MLRGSLAYARSRLSMTARSTDALFPSTRYIPVIIGEPAMFSFKKTLAMPSAAEALPDRAAPIPTAREHFIFHRPLKPPYPDGLEQAMFGMGCFCSGRTGHNEVVLVVFDPKQISYERLLKTFWENHNPTQGMRQGNDAGTQYRSGIYVFSPAQRKAAEQSKAMYARELKERRFDPITTEILDAPEFYFAEDYHQQYLAKNPMGYCGLGAAGASSPIGLAEKVA